MPNLFIKLITGIKIRGIFSIIFLVLILSILKLSANVLDSNLNGTKYLNIRCDFERHTGGGCYLKESYCSFHSCVCKPDFPINIEDIMCIQRYKKVGEICSIDAECDTNSYCVSVGHNYKLRKCVCRQGFSYSFKNSSCLKGHKGSLCSTDSDCSGSNRICSQSKCQCNYGFDWYQTDEQCYKKSRHGESCDSTINCRAYDRLSECDKVRKICICRQSLSQMNAIDQLTQKCIICPIKRYNNETKICIPETLEIEYKSTDKSMISRNSLQYVYIALSMSPFVVFAFIGFLYKFVSPRNNVMHNIVSNDNETQTRNAFTDDSGECDLLNTTRIDTNHSRLLVNLSNNEIRPIVCPPISPVLCTLISPRDPPPPYEASQEMPPPSYEQAMAASH